MFSKTSVGFSNRRFPNENFLTFLKIGKVWAEALWMRAQHMRVTLALMENSDGKEKTVGIGHSEKNPFSSECFESVYFFTETF